MACAALVMPLMYCRYPLYVIFDAMLMQMHIFVFAQRKS